MYKVPRFNLNLTDMTKWDSSNTDWCEPDQVVTRKSIELTIERYWLLTLTIEFKLSESPTQSIVLFKSYDD